MLCLWHSKTSCVLEKKTISDSTVVPAELWLLKPKSFLFFFRKNILVLKKLALPWCHKFRYHGSTNFGGNWRFFWCKTYELALPWCHKFRYHGSTKSSVYYQKLHQSRWTLALPWCHKSRYHGSTKSLPISPRAKNLVTTVAPISVEIGASFGARRPRQKFGYHGSTNFGGNRRFF